MEFIVCGTKVEWIGGVSSEWSIPKRNKMMGVSKPVFSWSGRNRRQKGTCSSFVPAITPNIADDGCHTLQRLKLAHVVELVGFSECCREFKIDRGPGRRRTRTNEEGIHHDNLQFANKNRCFVKFRCQHWFCTLRRGSTNQRNVRVTD